MSAENIPESFGDEFLEWFRGATEAAWATEGCAMRWDGGLSESEVVAIEERIGFPFPPDYRLFLRRLHTNKTDRPARRDRRFTDWRATANPVREAMAALVEDFVGVAGAGYESLGIEYTDAGDYAAAARKSLSEGPPLIPITDGRVLVANPPNAGNPVLGIAFPSYVSVIVYGEDLRAYLLNESWGPGLLLGEWQKLLGLGSQERFSWCPSSPYHERWNRFPFWGRFLDDTPCRICNDRDAWREGVCPSCAGLE